VETIKEKMIFLIGEGFLGQKIVSVFKEKGIKVVTAGIQGKENYSLDITDEQSLIYLFKDLNPDIVLLSAGITNVELCEADQQKALDVNVEGTRNVVDVCHAFDSKLVFFSSDYVFGGNKGSYTEKDEVNPINFYGQTKVQGEKLVMNLSNHLIARVSTLYGFNSNEDKSFFSFAMQKLKNNESIEAVNIVNSPTLTDDVAEAVFLMLEKDFLGLFHVAGSNGCSKYDLLVKACKVFGFDSSLVKEVSWVPGWKAKRPLNSSLDITKIQLHGIKMSSVEEGLIKIKKQINK